MRKERSGVRGILLHEEEESSIHMKYYYNPLIIFTTSLHQDNLQVNMKNELQMCTCYLLVESSVTKN